ncbi:hypothetical protein ACLB1T_01315 [Escherichia coli]
MQEEGNRHNPGQCKTFQPAASDPLKALIHLNTGFTAMKKRRITDPFFSNLTARAADSTGRVVTNISVRLDALNAFLFVAGQASAAHAEQFVQQLLS